MPPSATVLLRICAWALKRGRNPGGSITLRTSGIEYEARAHMPAFRPTRVRIAFGIALVSLGAAGGLLSRDVSQVQQSRVQVARTREVAAQLDHVLAEFRNSISASRGYAPDAIQLQRQSAESVQSVLRGVGEGISGDPDQQQRLNSLEAALTELFALERRRLELVGKEGPEAGFALFREGHGDQLDDRIRRIVSDMEAAEHSLLEQRQQDVDRTIRIAQNVFGATAVLALIILLGVYFHLEREIGRRARSESRLIHLNRLYAFLSQANQTMVRARTKDELFGGVCRVAVEHGQFAMAWIRTREPKTGAIRLAARSSREEPHLQKLQISMDEWPEGLGLSRSAIREEKRLVLNDLNDLSRDPGNVAWREVALAHGCLSAASLPIHVDGKLVGAFSLFADRTNFFDDETLRLLDEVNSDISFALHAIDQEEQRRNAESEVRRLNQELEERVVERTSQLAEANATLAKQNEEFARASRLKSDFLARVSHEFRTPLNSIIGFTDLLAEEGEGPLGESYSYYVQHVHEGAHHLLALVNDILDLSRIEAGRIDLRQEEFAAGEAIFEVLSVIAPLAKAKNIELHSDIASTLLVFGDRTRFKQILYNLLSNAVKFTPMAGRVQVNAMTDYGQIRFGVADTGIGIPADQQAAIFEEFTQVAPATSGVKEGAGLGLTITKRLVEHHGGRIWVQSKTGEGSLFYFLMPAARAGDHSVEQRSSNTA